MFLNFVPYEHRVLRHRSGNLAQSLIHGRHCLNLLVVLSNNTVKRAVPDLRGDFRFWCEQIQGKHEGKNNLYVWYFQAQVLAAASFSV